MKKLSLIAISLLFAITLSAQTRETKKSKKNQPEVTAAEQTATPPAADKDKEKDKDKPEGMHYRNIGPYRGGRSLTGAGIPGNPNVYYFGATGGGVWKSTDGAMTWEPLFNKEASPAIGSIAIAPSDPNVIYVGTGEACIRGNAAQGDGVYKSLDGGKTWKNIGLKDSRAIGKVIVNPRDPDIVLVAALGHPFGPNEERGVFRTADGGKTWQKVLYKNADTGAVDLAFDPNNPNIVFASLWQVRRTPWNLNSGGPGSGIYRSGDGGITWKEVESDDLPKKPWGKIGIAVASNSDRVYALIEAKEGGLYRSDDGGSKWQLVNPDRRLVQRAWYYMHIIADPVDENTVYVMNVDFHKSVDGGRSFNKISVPHGDNHGLWIDPTNNQRMMAVNDGGATVTLDGGKNWSSLLNQSTAQIYHVSTDNRYPYWIYGAQQDNTSIAIASRGEGSSIDRSDWYAAAGGESGFIIADPRDPLITYGGGYQGELNQYNKHTWQTKEISAQSVVSDAMGAAKVEHRFQWTAPLMFSPHDPNVIYHAAERIFKTSDGGMHWEAISPDLTRNDKSKQQPSGGDLTIDDTGTEYYDTIFALAESPIKGGVIWAGTDDGLLQLTQDGGKSWTNITPKDLPEWSRFSGIDASPFDAGTAYVAIDRHQNDDFKPYIYKTADYGKTWTKIVKGIPDGSFARAVREDPKRKGLLYAGTESGVFVSYDDGANWQSLQLDLPVVPVHDLVVKDNDLVLATHGRGFYVLDDLSPVRQHTDKLKDESVHLFTPAVAIRSHYSHHGKKSHTAGENPPAGALIYYQLKDKPKNVSIEILDEKGQRVRLVSSAQTEDPDEQLDPEDEKPKKKLEPKPGLNRFVWDLRYDDVPRMKDYYLYEYQDGTVGPMALPGKYQVKLTVDGQTQTAPLELKMDPRVTTSPADLQKQFALLMDIRQQFIRVYDGYQQIADVRAQLKGMRDRLPQLVAFKPVFTASSDLETKLASIQGELVNDAIHANEDSLAYGVKLDGQLAGLTYYVGGDSDSAPNAIAEARFAQLKQQVDDQLGKWKNIVETDLANFQKLARDQNIQAVIVPGTLGAEAQPAEAK
ncbi:MAG: VPS10 domain-containing protein [Terriglobales bacterium]